MYAIIKSGSKQYKVSRGDLICIDLLEKKTGESVEFKDVLFLKNDDDFIVGKPNVPNCVVKGEVIDEILGPKVIAFKYKRRKNYSRKIGHRQRYVRVKIIEIIQ